MSAALPAFQLASTLGPSTDEREEFAAHIRAKDAGLEELRGARQTGAMKPQEREALVNLLNDIQTDNVALKEQAAQQSKEIEDLQNVNDQLNEKIISVKGLAKDRIGELLAEIVDIRSARKLDNERVNDLSDWLTLLDTKINEHADSINKVWQVTKKGRTPTGKKSKVRVEQLKEILKGGSKTYKEIERLLKISPKEMNRLVSMLDTRSYEIFFRSGDNRQKVLRLRSFSKSLSSNVNNSKEEDSKAVQLLKV